MEDQKHATYGLTTQMPRQLFSRLLICLLITQLTEWQEQLATGTLHGLLFFFFLPPPSAFCSLNPPPFQHPSRHALTKGCVHFTFTVCSLSDVIGLGSSPDTPCAHFYLKQQRSGNTGSGFVAGEGCGFKERAFSHLVYFSPWFLITVTTTPQFLKVPNPTPYAITTWQG